MFEKTATPHPEGDRMLPDRQGDRHTPPRGRPQGSQPRINPTTALTKIRCAPSRILVVFVRAGVVWSGVGTLAVALGAGLGGRCLPWLALWLPRNHLPLQTWRPPPHHPEGDRKGPSPTSTQPPPLQRLPHHPEGRSLSYYFPNTFGYSAILLAQSSSCPKRITM